MSKNKIPTAEEASLAIRRPCRSVLNTFYNEFTLELVQAAIQDATSRRSTETYLSVQGDQRALLRENNILSTLRRLGYGVDITLKRWKIKKYRPNTDGFTLTSSEETMLTIRWG